MSDKAVLGRSLRARLPVVAVVLACVAGVAAAVLGSTNPVSAVQFLLPGHWVYNSSLQSVFHVDGSTGDVDARGRVPGNAGDQVFQGDTSGYVVGDSRITEFGKSSLSVEDSRVTPSRELPVGVETAGGPYLVYRETGQIVRLGDDHLVLSLGGPVGTPVATRDGTVWLPRVKAGLLCQLPAGAVQVSCPVLLPKGHPGGLSVVSRRVVFVDAREDTFQVVEKDGLGEPRSLGVDVADDARLASTEVGGRIAILDGQRMHLVDAGLGTAGLGQEEPVTVDLDDGEYAGPVSTGSVVAVVNLTTSTLSVYDREGKHRQSKEIPAESGDPRLTRGEDDRIYVDGAEGGHVVVVDKDGGVTDVPISDEDGKDRSVQPSGGQDPDAPLAAPKPGTELTEPPVRDPVPPRNPQTQQPQQNGPQQQQSPPRQDPPPPVEEEPPPPPVVEEEPPPPPVVPPSPPGVPTAVNATAGDASATVTWNPAQDNRSPITGYRVTWAGGETTVPGDARTSVVPGLANGTTYTFTVNAVNAVGAGPGAASNPVTPLAPAGGPPAAPTNLDPGYDPATGHASFTFTPPDLNGNALVHHVVTVTGVPVQYTTETVVEFDQIPANGQVTFSVRTDSRLPDGTILHGETASVTVDGTPPPAAGHVTLTRGPDTQEWCSPDPDCAWMHVELVGMQPNTRYDLMPHSTHPDYKNPGGTCTTDETGYCVTDQFAYHEAGYTVWVTVTGPDGVETRSNDLVWEGEG